MTEKFEQLLEFVVNDEMEKAEELFHAIVVEKSRQIYEGLISSEAEEVGGDDVDNLINAISDDENNIAEEGDEEEAEEIPAQGAADDMSMPLDAQPEGGDADNADVEARLDDITDALAQLKAMFADKLAGEDGDEHHAEPDGDEMGPMDAEIAGMDSEEPKEESVLEYKEAAPKPVLTDSPGNAKLPVAKKNDMGGTVKNIAQGSSEEKGRSAPKVGSLTSANTEYKLSKVSAPSNKA